MSYRQFLRHIEREITGVSTPPPVPQAAPVLVPPPPPNPIPATENPSHARHEPDARPTFVHDGRTKEGEPEKLFGPGFLPGSRK